MKRVVMTLVLALVGVITGAMVIATPSYATLGTCHPMLSDGSFDQYCEGTRPTEFRAWVYCTDNSAHYGAWEWAGDGIASQAYCPTNKFVTDYGTNYSAA